MKQLSKPTKDMIVETVVKKLRTRSVVGIKKYNTSLQDSQEGLLAFLKHTQMELLDAANYIEKVIDLLEE